VQVESARAALPDTLAEHDVFRNELASIAPDGRRRWIYARQPAGRLYQARTLVSAALLAILVAGPFVEVGGQPAVLLNVLERRFVFLGLVFWPQDFALVVLVALTILVGLALSTAAVGRIWCGWLCPQTVFMEMVFRRVEYLIEGSAAQQLRRNRGPWTRDRLWRAAVKHAMFFALSFAIANLFLAYVVGAKELGRIVTDPPQAHLTGLVAITLFSLVFYAVFARFREQACVLACPYGRVMSSLVDRRTITVTYDSHRGEPRGRLSRDADASARAGSPAQGDCVDCHQCVTVCPTGIDIRNGIQLECVNCTACIDACNDVMQRLDRPLGLIRLTSHDALAAGRRTWLTPRVAAYGGVWLLLVVSAVVLIARRPAVDALVLRQAGTLFTTMPSGDIVNFYTVQVFNRTAAKQRFELVATAPRGARITPLGPLEGVGPHALLDTRLFVAAPPASLTGVSTPVRFELRVAGGTTQRIDSSLIGPAGEHHQGEGR
jgi:cytochrome c oxidase accessory protein FixG